MIRDTLESLISMGLFIDVFGGILIASVIFKQSAGKIIERNKTWQDEDKDLSIEQITQKNNIIIGIILVLFGFLYQFLGTQGFNSNIIFKSIFFIIIFLLLLYYVLSEKISLLIYKKYTGQLNFPKNKYLSKLNKYLSKFKALKSSLPVITIVAILIAFWYVMVVVMNAPFLRDQAERQDRPAPSITQLVPLTMAQERPVLPAPHQVVAEVWKSTVGMAMKGRPFSKRSLIYHTWITLSATLLGFLIGTAFGIALAVGIVHNRAMDKSVMPWVITSQTIPILAIAPMIIVVLNAAGISGLLPKALISTYLSFFPVVVGMVAGLRAPDAAQLDLMHTYSASRAQTFWKLRLPASLPFLFTSLKIAVAISLVGAIVGEMPTGAVAGLGARLLAGSYYGQTIQIWSALFMAAALAATLVALVGLGHRFVLARMGEKPA